MEKRNCKWCGFEGIESECECPVCSAWYMTLPDVSTMGIEARVDELKGWFTDRRSCEIEWGKIVARFDALMGRNLTTMELKSSNHKYLIAELEGRIRSPETVDDLTRSWTDEEKKKLMVFRPDGDSTQPSLN